MKTEKHYRTKTRGERTQSVSRCLAEGKYLISVKNPQQPSPPGTGLGEKQKVNYPAKIQEKFANYRFINLNEPEFLDYEGAEVLLIAQSRQNLTERYEGLRDCWEKIPADDLVKEFAAVSSPEAVSSLK